MTDSVKIISSLPPGFSGYSIFDRLYKREMAVYTHISGFRISVLPRPGFSRKFVAIGVPYGSVHTEIKQAGRKYSFPAGTAHFLEHCVFSRDEQGGLLGSLTELGVSANAYTSYSHTLYYFTAVENFAQALVLYLQAVLDPYLETDRVESERPIIISEIEQYLDDPEARGMVSLLRNMYENHPLRHDIGGTAESVAQIKSEHLKQVKNLFYNPGMLHLTVAGDIDQMNLLETISGILPLAPASGRKPEIVDALESVKPLQYSSSLNMDISAPSFLVGIKDPLAGSCKTGIEQVSRQKSARLLLSTILSPASSLHEKLYNQGLINESFNYSYINDCSFGFAVCGGESMQPEAAAGEIIDGIIRQMNEGLDSGLFEIQKRSAAGSFVQALDSVEHSGIVQAQCGFNDITIFDYPEIYDKINCALAAEMMSFMTDPGQYCITIINPTEVKNNHES